MPCSFYKNAMANYKEFTVVFINTLYFVLP